MSQDQCDLPASPAEPARVPHVLHSYSIMASHSTTQVFGCITKHPTWFLPPNSYPVASQVLVDFPAIADLVPGYKSQKEKPHEFDHSSTTSPVPVLRNMLNQKNTTSYEGLSHPFSGSAPKPFCRPLSFIGSPSRMVLFPSPRWEGTFSDRVSGIQEAKIQKFP